MPPDDFQNRTEISEFSDGAELRAMELHVMGLHVTELRVSHFLRRRVTAP